jgi:hypothetical protein
MLKNSIWDFGPFKLGAKSFMMVATTKCSFLYFHIFSLEVGIFLISSIKHGSSTNHEEYSNVLFEVTKSIVLILSFNM